LPGFLFFNDEETENGGLIFSGADRETGGRLTFDAYELAPKPLPARHGTTSTFAAAIFSTRDSVCIGARTSRKEVAPSPKAWHWETVWTARFDRVSDPPPNLAA